MNFVLLTQMDQRSCLCRLCSYCYGYGNEILSHPTTGVGSHSYYCPCYGYQLPILELQLIYGMKCQTPYLLPVSLLLLCFIIVEWLLIWAILLTVLELKATMQLMLWSIISAIQMLFYRIKWECPILNEYLLQTH